MIRSLLLTSLISLGAGATAPAPLTNKTNFANNENTPTNYTLHVKEDDHIQQTSNNITSHKWTYQTYNDALMVKGNIYIQNTNGTYTSENNFNIYSEAGYNTALYMFQITPYKYLYGNKTTILLHFTFDNINEQKGDNLKITTTIYSSTNDWSKYLDLSNYTRAQNNKIIVDDITDTNNGYLYDSESSTENINIQNHMALIDNKYIITYPFQKELTMVNNKTNYYCIYVKTQYKSNPSDETDFEISNFISPGGTTLMTLSGQMIPPVTNYEIVDLPGTMFYILTMPFTFISTAFNLTLFPGTIYQFNIGNLFLTIIGTLTFLFLIRLLTRNK